MQDRINNAVMLLQAGHIIACETDTVLGFLADADNNSAIEQIFRVKQRPANMVLQVLVSSIDMALGIIEPSENFLKLAGNFWGGGLTIICPAKKYILVSEKCISPSNKIGVRMPSNNLALEIIQAFGMPVVATSANISGFSEPKNIIEYKAQFSEIECFYENEDFGRLASTVIELNEDGFKILRQGVITEKQILQTLNNN
jgi:L-threonylcarbamoyladenylate synthase